MSSIDFNNETDLSKSFFLENNWASWNLISSNWSSLSSLAFSKIFSNSSILFDFSNNPQRFEYAFIDAGSILKALLKCIIASSSLFKLSADVPKLLYASALLGFKAIAF